jgi:hypothetical protein
LPRSHSHNGSTNLTNKPQTIQKRKRNSRSKGHMQFAVAWADRPQGGGGLSAGTRRTVRELAADCPKKVAEPLVVHCEKWIFRPLPADHQRQADCPSSPRGTSAIPRATKNTGRNGSKQKSLGTHDEQTEHQAARLHADCPRPPGALSATRGQNKPNLKPQALAHLSTHGSPKWLEILRKYLGRCEVSLGDVMPQLEPSNELHRQESNRNRALPKVRVPTEILQSEAEFGVPTEILQSSTKMHEATIHDTHQQIRPQKPQNRRNKVRT